MQSLYPKPGADKFIPVLGYTYVRSFTKQILWKILDLLAPPFFSDKQNNTIVTDTCPPFSDGNAIQT